MKIFVVIIMVASVLVRVSTLSAQDIKTEEMTVTFGHYAGSPDTRYLVSKEANATYKITISLPKRYFADPNRKFPVLVLVDANVTMGVARTTFDLMTGQNELREVILVGVAHPYTDGNQGAKNRFRDMAPTPMDKFELSGNADKFVAFMEKELLPFIESHYQADASDRCFAGHSLGGLLATHVMLEKPDLFNHYIIGSPSYWWDDKEIIQRVSNKDNVLKEKKSMIYTYVGGQEGMMVVVWQEFNTLLKNKIEANVSYEEHIFPNETHASVVPTAFASAVRFIYGK